MNNDQLPFTNNRQDKAREPYILADGWDATRCPKQFPIRRQARNMGHPVSRDSLAPEICI